MEPLELLIFAGGRWRNVCPLTGRVDGWRQPARVVRSNGGVLTEVPAIPALSTAVKGPAVPKKRKPILLPTVRPSIYQKDVAVQTQQDRNSVQITNVSRFHNSISQTSQEHKTQRRKRNFRSVSTEILEEITDNDDALVGTEFQGTKSVDKIYLEHKLPKTKQSRKLVAIDKDLPWKLESNNQVLLSISSKHLKANAPQKDKPYKKQSKAEGNAKELIINECDVMLLRRYIETHNTTVDMHKFDMDDNYKMRVFYSYNPLVKIERCARIAKMLREHDSHITIHFAKQLGLCLTAESFNKDKTRKHRDAKLAAKSRLKLETTSREEYKRKKQEERHKKRKHQNKYQQTDTDSTSSNELVTCNTVKRSTRFNNRNKPIIEIDLSSDTEDYEPSTTIMHKAEVHKNKKRGRQCSKQGTDSHEEKNKTESDSSDNEILIKKVKERNIENNSLDSKVQSKKIIKDKKKVESIVFEEDSENDIESFKSSNLREKFKQNIKENNKKEARQESVNDDGILKHDKNKENIYTNDKINLERKTKFSSLRKFAVPKRSSVRPGREYSALEDQSIVAWLTATEQRERAVNGNRIWKELELSHQRLTGQKRTWHSLRNRYLRYILPGLAGLAIPSHDAQRLRAHAAIGELKAGKKGRRNSVFHEPPVLSAFTRVPRQARKRGNSESSEAPPSRILRSSTGSKSREHTQSPIKSTKPTKKARSSSLPPNRVPSPSKPTNRTQSTTKPINHRPRTRSLSVSVNADTSRTRSLGKSTNRVRAPSRASNRARSPDSVLSPNKSTNRKEASNKTRQLQSPRSSPTYSELTRRFALRNRSTPERIPKPELTHQKRRLYNPGQLPSDSSQL